MKIRIAALVNAAGRTPCVAGRASGNDFESTCRTPPTFIPRSAAVITVVCAYVVATARGETIGLRIPR